MDLSRDGGHPSGESRVPVVRCGDERPAWIQNGVKAVLMDGDQDLSVIGVTHYQENLWQLAAARPGSERVHVEVTALLVAENLVFPQEGDLHDGNAIAVWVDGLKVGHLSREDAARYRPGLAALERAHRMSVALRGVIAGGGVRDDGPGRLGVFLRHDPADFGASRRPGADALHYTAFGLRAEDLDDARMTYQSNYNHRHMNSGRGEAEFGITVARTGAFQDALRQSAIMPRPWRHVEDKKLPAVLAQVPGDPATVAVLVDGAVVGYLGPEVAERHHEQLQELARDGQYLVGNALIVGGQAGKSFGVRLSIKPGIGTRWAAGTRPTALGRPAQRP